MSKTTHQGAPGTENCPESEEIFNAEITVKLAQNPKRDIASPEKSVKIISLTLIDLQGIGSFLNSLLLTVQPTTVGTKNTKI